MQSFHLSFEYSAWWLLPMVLVSAALAWWMYNGKNVWTPRVRKILSSLRFLVFFLVLLLLLNPQFTVTTSFKEKPLFPLLVDNSASILLGFKKTDEIKATLATIQETLEEKGFDAPILSFENEGQKPDSLVFDQTSTNLAQLLGKGEQKQAKAKNANALLISDGIFNVGSSPEYQLYKSKVFTLGLGDTSVRKDVALKSIQNNSVAFLGNKFMLRAELRSTGFAHKNVEVVLKGSKGNVIEKQTLQVEGDSWHQQVDFTVLAQEKGYQRYSIEVIPLSGESNLLNNKLSTYIDIVDDRENVLMISMAPHPNVKAIRSALSKLDNLHLEVYIPGFETPKQGVFDLVILNNCLLSSIGEASKYIKETTPVLYLAGTSLNYSSLQAESGLLEVLSKSQTDLVHGSLNPNFGRFKLNEETGKLLSKLPPIEVVFGDMKARSGTEVLLYQQINGVVSDKPLLLFGQGKRKAGAFLSDGLWLMRMYEAQDNETTELMDELIAKTIHYLSDKEDKRKFRIYPHQREYYEGESPQIEVELYNDLYEKVYGQKTRFQIQSNQRKYTYEFSPVEGASALFVNPLPPNVYKVTAETQFGGKTYSAQAEFIVKERQLEALDLQANHQLLRQISQKSEGQFFAWSKKDLLIKELEKLEATAIWKSKDAKHELIDEKWYYFLIIALVSAEWIIRRYTGGY